MGYGALQPTFSSGELAPALAGRVDLAKYHTGLATCRNFFTTPFGGVYDRPGTKYLGEVKDSGRKTRLIPFAFSQDQSYVLEFGHLTMRVIRLGGIVTEAAKAISGASQAAPVVLTIVGHGFVVGDDIFVTGVGGMPELDGRVFRVAAVIGDGVGLADLFRSAIDGRTLAAYGGGGTAARLYTLATAYQEADLPLLKYTQSADVMTLTHPDYLPHELSRRDHDDWSIAPLSFAPAVAPPPAVTASSSHPDTGADTQETYYYVVTAVADTLEEGPPSPIAECTGLKLGSAANTTAPYEYPTNTIGWTAVTGAGSYCVYKTTNKGVWGYIGQTTETSFVDTYINPDYTVAPPTGRNPFIGDGNYPRCCCYYQQRRVLTSTTNQPLTIWASRTGYPSSFDFSIPSRDDDSLEFTLYAEEVNEIRHMLQIKGNLVVATGGGIWVVNGGDSGAAITPSAIAAVQELAIGVADLRPITIGSTVLYTEATGAVVYDLAYAWAEDSYGGADLTVTAPHLLRGKAIVDWAYARIPYSIVWMVRDDGILLGLTYMREHQVVGWHRHDSQGGAFEAVCSIREGKEHAVYVIVRRTLQGRVVRCLERFETRLADLEDVDPADCYHVDCGLSYSGSAVKTISGLWHLEGESVAVLGDGSVFRDLTVANGAITLPVAVSKAHIGLPITAELRTLRPEVSGQAGSIQGRRQRYGTVTVRVHNTRGLMVGPDADHLTALPVGAYAAPSPLVTDDVSVLIDPLWSNGASLVLRKTDPTPAAILAVVPELAVG